MSSETYDGNPAAKNLCNIRTTHKDYEIFKTKNPAATPFAAGL